MSKDASFQHYRKLYAPHPGQPVSELTQAKSHWRTLPEPERDEWIAFVFSAANYEKMRQWILERSGISLHKRDQMQRFRKWLGEQDVATRKAREYKQIEEQLQKENPNATLDEIREKVLQKAYFSTLAKEDFKTGLQTVNAHCRTESVQISKRRYEDSKRSAEKKAMHFCLDETADYPEVQKLFEQAFAAFRQARTAK